MASLDALGLVPRRRHYAKRTFSRKGDLHQNWMTQNSETRPHNCESDTRHPEMMDIDKHITYMLESPHMIRTQVYLTEEQARDIKLRAQREQKREAEVIRDLLNKGLQTPSRQQGESTGESLLRLAAIGGKGPADLPMRIDDYLYGEDS